MTATDSGTNDSLGPVDAWEKLGRRVFSSSQSKKAANGKVPLQIFLEVGNRKISVDRLTTAPLTVTPLNYITAEADEAGAKRYPSRSFYGWAVVDTEQVLANGCTLQASPLPNNPYHANIVLPDVATTNAEAQRQYATALASIAKWKPRPADKKGG